MTEFDAQVDRLDQLAGNARELEHRIMEAKGYLVRDGERRLYGEAAVQAQPDPRLASLASLDAEGQADDLRRSVAAVQRELSEIANRKLKRRLEAVPS